MVFDGRFYRGALPIPPVQYQPGAPAVGELAAGGLRAAYLYAQHQATLIGSQTWPMRRRRGARPEGIPGGSSLHRIAEWCAVHLAEHHSHVVCELTFVTPDAAYPMRLDMQVTVTDGTASDAGARVEISQRDMRQGPTFAGYGAWYAQAVVALSTVTRPLSTARVYLDASTRIEWDLDGSLSAAGRIIPLGATAWRVTVP